MTRHFDPSPLGADELLAVLDLARRVPSAGFAQGSSFLVLTGDTRERFWRVSGAGQWFAVRSPGVLAAPVVVLPIADRAAYLDRYTEPDKIGHGLEEESGWPVPHWLTDTALAVQQLLLLAEDRGWGALYAGLFRDLDPLRREFGLPDHVTPLGFVALGRRAPDDRPTGSPVSTPRRPLTEVVHIGRWGGATGLHDESAD